MFRILVFIHSIARTLHLYFETIVMRAKRAIAFIVIHCHHLKQLNNIFLFLDFLRTIFLITCIINKCRAHWRRG